MPRLPETLFVAAAGLEYTNLQGGARGGSKMRAFVLATVLGTCWIVSVGCAHEVVREQDNVAQAAMTDFKDDARCAGQGLREGSNAYGLCRKALVREHDRGWTLLSGS